MAVEKVYYLKEAVIGKEYKFRHASYDNNDEAEDLLSNAIGEQPGGIIIDFEPSSRLVNALKKNGIATVSYDHASEEFSSVSLNRPAGVKKSVSAMIKAGRKRIVLLGEGGSGIRGKGYTLAHEKASLKVDTGLIWGERFGRDLYVYGYEQGKKLIAELEFDAVQCVNDACAIGLIKALSEAGKRVPEDISVAGFDDIMPSRYQVPALSTVAQPKEEMAEKTVDFLLKQMEKQTTPQHIVLETEFVKRETI